MRASTRQGKYYGGKQDQPECLGGQRYRERFDLAAGKTAHEVGGPEECCRPQTQDQDNYHARSLPAVERSRVTKALIKVLIAIGLLRFTRPPLCSPKASPGTMSMSLSARK